LPTLRGVAVLGLGTGTSRASHGRIEKEMPYRALTIEAVMVATAGA
jgi:hypothetical protein